MIRIRTDDVLFIVSRKSLENICPNSILINNDQLQTHELIIGVETEEKNFSVTTIYMNIDPIIMKQIVRLLRGSGIEKSFDDYYLLHP